MARLRLSILVNFGFRYTVEAQFASYELDAPPGWPHLSQLYRKEINKIISEGILIKKDPARVYPRRRRNVSLQAGPCYAPSNLRNFSLFFQNRVCCGKHTVVSYWGGVVEKKTARMPVTQSGSTQSLFSHLNFHIGFNNCFILCLARLPCCCCLDFFVWWDCWVRSSKISA